MAGLFDWISDGTMTSPIFGGGGGTPMPPVQMTGVNPSSPPFAQGGDPVNGSGMPPYPMGTDPMTAGLKPPTPDPLATQSMPPVQQTGADQPSFPPGGDPMEGMSSAPADPMIAGGSPPNGPGLPQRPIVPLPQPRPPGADAAPAPPGQPVSLAPPAPGPSTPAGNAPPAQTWLGRALGITPDQAGKQGQQIMSGLGAGLKAVPANAHAPGLAAFAGTAGAALEGGSKKSDTQQKQAADFLKASIDAKKADDDAGYKQNYLRYLAAKLQADTDKAANKDASANKNDTPTQLYLSAQRLVQPERNALSKRVEQMRKEGADPAEITKVQAEGEAAITAKLSDHYATLGVHPQAAAAIGQQPGNSQANPIDAGKLGITKDNIATKLQPGQYYTNPADGKVYQFKGQPKQEGDKKTDASKPTNPEPADPMNSKAITTGKMTPSVKAPAAADDDED